MIREIFICIIVGMSVASPVFTAESEFTVDVIITGGEPRVGQVLVSLFNSSANYLETPLLEATADVDDEGNALVELGKQVPGEYAIVVVYDKNKNGKLDTGFFRIPKEKIGYSNNAKGKLGPAKWDDTRFTVTNSALTIDIELAKPKRD